MLFNAVTACDLPVDFLGVLSNEPKATYHLMESQVESSDKC